MRGAIRKPVNAHRNGTENKATIKWALEPPLKPHEEQREVFPARMDIRIVCGMCLWFDISKRGTLPVKGCVKD
jgi:hypothetical protein